MRRYLGNLKYTFVSLQRLKYRMIFVVVNFISNFSSKINGVFVVAQIVFELCAENWWIVSCSLHCHLMAFPKHGELCCPNQSTKHIWTLSSICSSRFLLAMGPYAVCAACCVPVQTWWPGMSVEGARQGWAQPHPALPFLQTCVGEVGTASMMVMAWQSLPPLQCCELELMREKGDLTPFLAHLAFKLHSQSSTIIFGSLHCHRKHQWKLTSSNTTALAGTKSKQVIACMATLCHTRYKDTVLGITYCSLCWSVAGRSKANA